MSTVLNTPRLLLRAWKPGDEEALARYASNRKISIRLRDRFPFPYTLKDAQEWVGIANNGTVTHNFAIEFEGQVVGGIGLMPGGDIFRRSAELGYWLGEPFWGKGLMVEAVKAVTEYAHSRLDYVRIFAGVFEGNPASAKVLEKAGYVFESRMKKAVIKEDQFLDQLMYVSVV